MKKFFLKSLYLLPLVLFLIFMECRLSIIKNSYTYKRSCLENQLDSIEVLVLGTSQAARGINPSQFTKKGYNLANLAQTIYYDTRITLNYADKMPKLKYVIINVSYFPLGFQLKDDKENWRDYFYYQFWNINYYELEKFDIKKYSKIFLYTPATSLSYLKESMNFDLIGGYTNSGYLDENSPTNKIMISDTLGKERVTLHDSCFKENRLIENKNDLDFFLSELKKRKLIPIFLTPPVYSTYYKYVKKEKLAKIHAVINMLCEKYKCKYYDYFMDTTFTKADFKDNDHLNYSGAQKFSKLINKEILEKN